MRAWTTAGRPSLELAFRPDGNQVAQRDAEEIIVWELPAGREIRRFKPPNPAEKDRWEDMTWADDGRLLAVADQGGRGNPVVWDLLTEQAVLELLRPPEELRGLAAAQLSRNGQWLVFDPNGTVPKPAAELKPCQVHDVATRRPVANLTVGDGDFSQVSSPVGLRADGKRLLSLVVPIDLHGGQGIGTSRALLWSLPEDRLLARVPSSPDAHAGPRSFSPDGSYVVLDAEDGSAVLLDAESGATLVRWRPHGDRRLRLLAFTPDGQVVSAVRGGDGLVFLDLAAVRQRLAALGLNW